MSGMNGSVLEKSVNIIHNSNTEKNHMVISTVTQNIWSSSSTFWAKQDS